MRYCAKRTDVLLYLVLLLSLGTSFVFAQETEHFGVDGDNIKVIGIIAHIGDGHSSSNALTWGYLEPQAPVNGVHIYRWDLIDAKYKQLILSGRKLQLTISPRNLWAIQGDAHVKSQDPNTGKPISAIVRIRPECINDWKNFITELLKRYSVPYLQIDSEPENTWMSVDGFLEAVCSAQSAAHKIDPSIKILVSGFNVGNFFAMPVSEQNRFLTNRTIQHKINFIKDLLAKGNGCFDILSIHLNRDYKSIDSTVAWFKKQI